MFALRFKCTDDVDKVTYSWGTKINEDMSVFNTLENSETVVRENVDILEQWKNDLFGAGESAISDIHSAAESERQQIAQKGAETIESIPADYNTLVTDVSELKGDITQLRELNLIYTSYQFGGYMQLSNGNMILSEDYKCIYTSHIPCKSGDVFGYKGSGKWSTASWVYYRDGVFVFAGQVDSRDKYTEVIVPDGVDSVVFSSFSRTDSNIIFDIRRYSPMDIRTKVDDIEGSVATISKDVHDISNLFYEFIKIEYTEEPSYILSSSTGLPLNMISENPNYVISSLIGVEPGNILHIVANSHYSSYAYAFYDINGDFMLGEKPETGGDTFIDIDKDVEVPKWAYGIRIAYLKHRKVGSISKFQCPEKLLYKVWSGKKWAAMGDSLTEANRRTTMHYHDYIANTTGVTVVNLGISGTGYMRQQDNNKAFYQRVNDIPLDSDVVTIFGSGNDLSLTLGEVSDTGTDTICGCINTTIDNIIALIPTVSLGIVSPTPWVGQQPSNKNCSMAKYTEALETICNNRSIPFLDLYHSSNLRPWTEEGRTACFSKDEGNGVHPDEAGHKLIAGRFKAFLDSLII